MESIDINIVTFINPHLFFITDVDTKQRTRFLCELSGRIKKSHDGLQNESFLVDQMVAVYYESDLVRATILEKTPSQGTNNIYFCWLVDYAILIQTEKVFKLPEEIQRITPRAKQACLNNICYLKEHLELGVTGKIKSVPSIIPSSGVTQYCLQLFSNCSKLVFDVVERYNNILIGDVIIYKNDEVLYLTKELCSRGLVTIDELIFERIKYSTKEYVKTHLQTIRQISKTQKIHTLVTGSETGVSPIKLSENSEHNEIEEIDIKRSQVLENGRRRSGLPNKSFSSSQTSGSDDDHVQKKIESRATKLQSILKQPQSEKAPNNTLSIPVKATNRILSQSEERCEVLNQDHLDLLDLENPKTLTECSAAGARHNRDQLHVVAQKVRSPETLKSEVTALSRTARVLQKIEEAKKALEEKVASDTNSINAKSSDDTWNRLVEFRKRKQRTSSCSTKSEEGIDSTVESSLEDNKDEQTEDKSFKSPFGDITSQRKTKPSGLFLPAGMENRFNKEQQMARSKTVTSDKRKHHVPKITSSSSWDDDCPTVKITKPSDNLTDDQTSAGEADDKTKKEKEEESSSSDIAPREIFTKQDFCRLVSGGCTCIKCRITLEDDDWDAPLKFGQSSDGEAKKQRESTGLVIKPSKLLRKDVDDETFIQENEILSIDFSSMSTIEKKMSCKILVHGETIPNPVKRVSQVNIEREIYNNINRLNYKETKKIQQYAFPAITRNQHVVMINDAGSGKTMAYLPILCSFVMEKYDRYSQLLKMGGGPIVVILCSNSKKCQDIYDLIRLIFGRQRCRVSLVTYPGYGNISNIDILITMPVILTTLISSRATNFKRLCHFVLEDGDVILKTHHELVSKFLDYGDQVLEHRHCPKSIQIILCAEHWTLQIEDILKKLSKVPLVCIGNHLEAALYGKISFTMKFLDTSCKEQHLQRILQDVYKFTKSIIICDPKEVEEIETFLPLKGIEYTTIPDAGDEDISYFELVWNKALPGHYSVLICTDDIYNTMNVTSAQLLIHYSLPRSWTQFIRRFSCLLENTPTPLNIKERKDKISTFVFIDENCEPRMSKFYNFVKIAGLEKDLPEKVNLFFKEFARKEEFKRVTKKIELCATVKIFGRCDSLHCRKRHVLDKELDNSEILPKNGTLKFKLIKMTDAASCSIKLLEHFDLNGQSVQKFRDLTDDVSEVLARNAHYHHVSKAVESHLYLYNDCDTYYRCKLVEVGEYALLYLIDRGIYCKSDLNKLLKMPEELKKIPQQCYEVHFASLIPPHQDTKFSKSAKHKAQFLVDGNCLDSVMTAKIVLQLGHNLWLEDVCEEREMFDKNLPSIGYQLTRELVKQELAAKSETTLAELYTLSKNAGIVLPEYKVVKSTTKRVKVEQIKPQWAFLEMDAINQVQFSCGVSPGEFYVKHQNFNKQLIQLEQDIQNEISKPFYPVPQIIEVGKCYLVKDEPTGNYSRALVLNITDDQAHLFCVDYGDDVTVPVSSLKHISNNMILKLPFQSIQCSMYGIKPIDDSWNLEATDFLYKVGFEEGTDIFRTLFIKTCSKERNDFIPKQNSYSVIVKDGFNERHVLLNELLIDCGFAVPNGHAIQDFGLPKKKEESEDEYIEEISRSDSDIEVEVEHDTEKDNYYGEDLSRFDIEIYDVAGFMTEMDFPVRKINEVNDAKAIEGKKTKPLIDDLPPMKAAPAVDYFTPEVYWSQTDSNIKLIIKIHDVQDPKMQLLHNRIFQFNTENSGKKYHLKLIFYEKVEKTFQYKALGPELRVTLTKVKQEEWPRLSHSGEKIKNVHYDFSTLKDEEKTRRPLQLDISDSSSEDDENDGMIYYVCSDLDSEYDYDIPNDE